MQNAGLSLRSCNLPRPGQLVADTSLYIWSMREIEVLERHRLSHSLAQEHPKIKMPSVNVK